MREGGAANEKRVEHLGGATRREHGGFAPLPRDVRAAAHELDGRLREHRGRVAGDLGAGTREVLVTEAEVLLEVGRAPAAERALLRGLRGTGRDARCAQTSG